MTPFRSFILVVALFPATVFAADTDPRLAIVRHAWVEAVDDLGDDQTVARCLADRLTRETPMTLAETKDDAEVILQVQAHIPSGGMRYMFGGMGGSPSAHLTALLPDGTKLWDDGAKARLQGSGTWGAAKDETSLACSLADRLLSTLRDAMRKARDKGTR